MSDHSSVEQLWEYAYGLLTDEQAANVEAQIDADPTIAEQYAKVRQQMDFIAQAARLEQPRIPLGELVASQNSKATVVEKPARSVNKPRSPEASPRGSGSLTRFFNPLAITAASLLVLLSGYAYFQPNSPIRGEAVRRQQTQVAGRFIGTMVTGPDRLRAGAAGLYQVTTTRADGQPVSREVMYRVFDPQGELKIDRRARTDERGSLTIELAPNQAAPGGRLEVETDRGGGPKLATMLTTHLQVEPPRYMTHLSLDKPLYRPGETVYFRSLTLSRFGLADVRPHPVEFSLLSPSGAPISTARHVGVTQQGVGNGAFTLPAQAPGGKYTLVAENPLGGFPKVEKEFHVRQYRTPRLKKQLEFTRDSYAPGDTVIADFSAHRAEGGPAAGAALEIQANVDGEPLELAGNPTEADETKADPTDAPKTDGAGAYQVRLKLPQEIDKGQSVLAVIVDDGGVRETIAKSIPINLGKVEVDFYPEGGDLTRGLVNRVYFHARDPLNKSVHIKGEIIDDRDQKLAKVETNHEGRGVFQFRPAAGRTYRLRITSPPGVAKELQLPKASDKQFVTLNTGKGVFDASAPLVFDVQSTRDASLVAAAVCRGVQVGQKEAALKTKQNTKEQNTKEQNTNRRKETINRRIVLPLTDQAEGVIRLTLYDYAVSPPRPVAERLVYRRPARKLRVQAADHQESYSPGEKVKLSLKVRDEHGQPAPAVIGVKVVDDALLNLARDKSPQMTTQFLLASEIEKPEDLEDANFFLQETKESAEALDLLLGTQGWRRFVERTAQEHLAQQQAAKTAEAQPSKESIERLLAMDNEAAAPVLQDNRSQVSREFRSAMAVFEAQRETSARRLGGIAILGGLGLLLLIGCAAPLRLVSGAKVWAPALSCAIASLLLGGAWWGGPVDNPSRIASLPVFASHGNTRTTVAPDQNASRRLDELKRAEGQLGTQHWGWTANPNRNDFYYFSYDHARKNRKAQQLGWFDDGRARGWALFGASPRKGADRDAMALAWRKLRLARRGNDGRRLAENDGYFGNDGIVGDQEVGFEAMGGGGGGGFGGGGFGWQRGNIKGWATRPAYSGFYVGANLEQQLERAAKKGLWKEAAALAQALEKAHEEMRFPVRQYAHQHQPAKDPVGNADVRSDFQETLFWNPLLIADETGDASIEFDLSDAVTSFRVVADAHYNGRLGVGGGEVLSRIPFNLSPKLPLEVNAGDRIDLPLAINNETKQPLPVEVRLEHSSLLNLADDAVRNFELPAASRQREMFTLNVVGEKGEALVEFQGRAGGLTDGVRRSISVVPPGFPVSRSYAGRIKGEVKVNVELPRTWVPGSLDVTLSAFPSSLAELRQGVAGMMREPSGCFEQTSSSNYPNILVLRYMQQHNIADPQFTQRAKELLQKGYTKLVSFECPKKGYEWFGGDPGHEALTAYGLMEFHDMNHVWDVDQQMVSRSAKWLLARRDGEGGFRRNNKALDSFGRAPQEITTAYVTWALTEAGEKDLQGEIDHVLAMGKDSKDPYLIALAAMTALNTDRRKTGRQLLKQLASLQESDGHLTPAQSTITKSGGVSAQVEATSLAVLAWLKHPDGAGHATKAVQWITNNRQGGGGFGSTQATVLALKALVAYAEAHRRQITAGELIVELGDQEIGRTAFAAEARKTIMIDGLADPLRPGKNPLTIRLTGDNQIPYTIDVAYRTRKPLSDPDCPLRLTAKLGSGRIQAGQTVPLSIQLHNTSGEGQPMSVAILGLPAGLEPRSKQLDDLKEAKKFDYYEIRGRELVFYWRSLAPDVSGGHPLAFNLDLIAEIPGHYTGPASRAYLYYTAEHKHWIDPLEIEIEPNNP